jgi:hypothetical protein
MDLCWFCEKNPGEEILEVTLVGRTSSAAGLVKNIKVESVKVPIPRCSKCAKIHRFARNTFGGYLIAGALAGVMITISLVAIFYKELIALKNNTFLLILMIVLLLIPFEVVTFLAYFAFEKKKKKKYFEELVGKSKIRLDNQETLFKHPAVNAWCKILSSGRGSTLQINWKR